MITQELIEKLSPGETLLKFFYKEYSDEKIDEWDNMWETLNKRNDKTIFLNLSLMMN